MASRLAQPALRAPYRLLLAWCILCCTSIALSTNPLSESPEHSLDEHRTNAGLVVDEPPLAVQDSATLLPEEPVNYSAEFLQKDIWDRTRIPLPVDNPTKSFWLDTPGANPLAEVGSTGKLTEEADVCVIGSGITGVSAAWHLSNLFNDESGHEDKTSIVILEARRFCYGATGRNGGHLVPNLFSSFLSRQALHNTSEALKTYLIEHYTAKTILDFINDKNLGDTVDLVEGGHITLFRTEKEEIDARKDYEAAKSASLGSDMEDDLGVRWVGNEELQKKYGLSSELNYTGVYFGGHNLWPCKVVTGLFEDAQASTNVQVDLHTKTPVTRFVPISNSDSPPHEQIPLSSPKPHTKHRRWALGTPRGEVRCSYVLHATNGYAGHLLPFMAQSSPIHPKPACKCHSKSAHPLPHYPSELSGSEFSWPSVPVPHHPHPHPYPIPQNIHTIVPTRGQVGAVRASVNASEFAWLNAWDGGAGGWEYWFPRYQDTAAGKNPLVILGGGRQFATRLEAGVTDDSELNPDVSKALRGFLPWLFPGQFDDVGERKEEGDPWEMEWTGIMGFTKSRDPYIGPIGPLIEGAHSGEYHHEGQYIAAGYSGHGMTRAFACAEAIAGMISAKIRGEEWTAPKWLPESYLTWAQKAGGGV